MPKPQAGAGRSAHFSGRVVRSAARGYRRLGMPTAAVSAAAPPPDPIPLAPFERLMLADARPGHPLHFYIECDVEGDLDEARFGGAVATAVRRHPLLSSRIVYDRGCPAWVPADEPPPVEWPRGAGAPDPWRPIDPARGCGWRLVVFPAMSDGAAIPARRVVLVVQHACCDGIAALEFLGDVWAAYAGVAPPPLHDEAVTICTTATAESPSPAAAPPVPRWRQALSFAWFRPTPLAHDRTGGQPPPGHRNADVPPAPPYETLALDGDATERLHAAAVAVDASLNDLLVAAAMLTIARWNERLRGRSGNVRITVPVSLRGPRQRLPARNVISYAFIDRAAAALRDPRALVVSIKEATRWILATGAAGAFLDTLGALAGIRGGLALVTRVPVCFSTAVVSNVGDASRRMRSGVPRRGGRDAPGDVVIRAVAGVPPLRPGTRLALGIVRYAGGLTISCLCSAHPDPRLGARRFLDLLAAELEALGRDLPSS
jgi:hypothetical protein